MTYIAELSCLATKCFFETHLEEALHDRLVCRLKNKSTQWHLLTQLDLDLATAIKTAQSMETVHSNALTLKGQIEQETVNKMEEVAPEGKSPRTGRAACYYCRQTTHHQSDCRFKEIVCHKVWKQGTFG